LGSSVSIGANTTIVCGHILGKHCLIGADSVVTQNVPAYAIVFGNPSRVVGWISEAGKNYFKVVLVPAVKLKE